MREFECYRCHQKKPEGDFFHYWPIFGEGLCKECEYSMDDIEHDADVEYIKMMAKEARMVAIERGLYGV